jgi:hypothetical protein
MCPVGGIMSVGVGLKSYRTIFNARAASCAAVFNYAAGAFSDFDFEIAWGSLDRFQISVGDQLDVHVPADLDQFGRDNSHGTVVGGEGLVQLGHDAPDRWRFFEQVDVISGICQIQGRLHPGDPASDNHH